MSGKKSSFNIMLAKKYTPNIDITGWYISEKFDGIRAYWKSKDRKLYTRNGNIINAPEWYINKFPNIDLDGELWINRGKFNKVSGIVRTKIPNDKNWEHIKYMVFDLPTINKIYEMRVQLYIDIIRNSNCKWLISVKIHKIKNISDILIKLKQIEKKGGEGLMIRKPSSLYENKRSSSLLKIKSFSDEEGTVIGYNKGIGKYKNMIGSLCIINKSGKKINVGTGLSDELRKNPPKIGSNITYKYFEKGKDGIPRFPIYVSERYDL